jgi:hypothetical protein
VNCLSENSDVKENSPWVSIFFIYSLFHTDICRFNVRHNYINVSISSSESDSELTVMNSGIAHFARLQETTYLYALTLCLAMFPVVRLPALRPPVSQYALTLCLAMFPVLRLPALRPPVSQYALTLCHAVFPVLRLPALLCPALRPPASQCAPGLKADSHINSRVYAAPMPFAAMPCH